MSLTKRWLEEVSESMGLDGEITDAVIEHAHSLAEARQDQARENQSGLIGPCLEIPGNSLDGAQHPDLERPWEDGRLDPDDL